MLTTTFTQDSRVMMLRATTSFMPWPYTISVLISNLTLHSHSQNMSCEQEQHLVNWHLDNLIASTIHNSQSLFLLIWFFAILISVPSLFLCIYLSRRCFSQQGSTAAMVRPDQWAVGTELGNNNIPSSSSVVGAGYEKEECCICLSLFQGNEKVKVLIECKHAFHSECLDMWLTAHPTCPLCRSSLHDETNMVP